MRTNARLRWGIGVTSQVGGTVTANALTVSDTDGPGIYVAPEGTFACTVTDSAWAAALVAGGDLSLVDSVLAGWSGPAAVTAVGAYGPSTLSMSGSNVSGGSLAAVWLDGAGSYRLEGNDLNATDAEPATTLHGNALYATGTDAWDDGSATGLSLEGNTFRGAAGPAVLLHAASAAFDDTNSWVDDGADAVWQQACDEVRTPPPGIADVQTTICPDLWGLVTPLSFVLYPEDDQLE